MKYTVEIPIKMIDSSNNIIQVNEQYCFRKENFDEKLDKYISDVSNNKSNSLGEFGQCSEPIINILNISHRIDNIQRDDDKIKIDFEILDTPAGQRIKNLEENDKSFSFQLEPRFYGHWDDNNIAEIVTFDIIDPV